MVYYVACKDLANAVAAMNLLKFDPGPIQRTEIMYADEGKLYTSETRKFVYGWGNLPSYHYVVFEPDKMPEGKMYQILSVFGHFWKKKAKLEILGNQKSPSDAPSVNILFSNLRSIW